MAVDRGIFRARKREVDVLKLVYENPGLNIHQMYCIGKIPSYVLRYWVDEFLFRRLVSHRMKAYGQFYSLTEKGSKYYQKKLKELNDRGRKEN